MPSGGDSALAKRGEGHGMRGGDTGSWGEGMGRGVLGDRMGLGEEWWRPRRMLSGVRGAGGAVGRSGEGRGQGGEG